MPQEHKFSFNLGADPECTFVRDGRMARANSVMDTLFNGDINHKSAGNFGKDGHSDTAELRPSPAKTPKELTKNIKDLIKSFTDEEFCIDIITESKFRPIGGHIHFELEEASISSTQKALQSFLTAMYIPLMLGETKKSNIARIREGYGVMRDYKIHQPGEGVETHEFRCPSAEWLTSEKLTEATFAYWFVVYHEYKKDKEVMKDIILGNEGIQNAMQMITLEKPELAELFAKQVIDKVKTFEHYETYKEQIDFVTDWNKVQKHKKDLGYSVRNGWGSAIKQIPIRSIAKANTETPENTNQGAISMLRPMHNRDVNTEFFANILGLIQLNTKKVLRNKYYIYGMKGIEEPVLTKNRKYYAGLEQAVNMETKNKMDQTVQRMTEKVENSTSSSFAKEAILIGLPLKMRVAANVQPFLKLIKMCEKGLETEQAYTPAQGKNIKTIDIGEEQISSVDLSNAPSSGYFNLTEDEIITYSSQEITTS